MAHLLVTVTGHGFGHIAQTGPVLAALRQCCPDLRLTVVSTAPAIQLRQRLPEGLTLIPRPLDFGFVMADPFRIDVPASARAYRALHADWDARVVAEAGWLRELPGGPPDLVLSNVAYLPLAAASRAGIPAYAMSSLNWADLFAATFLADPGEAAWAAPIHAQMLAAYRGARAFLRLTPGMAMADLANVLEIAPVARLGHSRRGELARLLGIPEPTTEATGEPTRIVLAALGGISGPAEQQCLTDWPHRPGWRWLVPAAWQAALPPAVRAARPDIVAFEPLGWDFTDLLASVDAVVGKPGYGTFTEAACNGTPMLYAPRPGWAEQDALIPWLAAHGRCREISEAQLASGTLLAELEELWQQPPSPLPAPDGARQAADLLAAALKQREAAR